jgi:hypothetical protein
VVLPVEGGTGSRPSHYSLKMTPKNRKKKQKRMKIDNAGSSRRIGRVIRSEVWGKSRHTNHLALGKMMEACRSGPWRYFADCTIDYH